MSELTLEKKSSSVEFVGGKWQTIIGASNVAFEREAWRFGLDLVNACSST